MVIYKASDKIPVSIGAIKFWISPLTALQKIKVLSLTKLVGGVETPDAVAMAIQTLRCSVKGVEGDLKYHDGDSVELKQDEKGELDDDSINAILEIADNSTLISIASKLATTGLHGMNLEGVSVDFESVVSVKKKSN